MTLPARQPQGIPTGGEFAPDVRAEPTIALEPFGNPEPRPDMKDPAARAAYLAENEARYFDLRRNIQGTYMVEAAQKLQSGFPQVETFLLGTRRGRPEITAGWDANDKRLSRRILRKASDAAFSGRYAEDLTGFMEGKVISVQRAMDFRPRSLVI